MEGLGANHLDMVDVVECQLDVEVFLVDVEVFLDDVVEGVVDSFRVGMDSMLVEPKENIRIQGKAAGRR